MIRRTDQGYGGSALVSAQWFRWNDQREMAEVDLTHRVGSGHPTASLDVDGDGAAELILFADHYHSSELIVLHDLASARRTRLPYDQGVRLIQTSQR